MLVSALNEDLRCAVEGWGDFHQYTAWEKDISNKWRQGLEHADTYYGCEWFALLADDVWPDSEWFPRMANFLKNMTPGQYGFRLTTLAGDRTWGGEDWMCFEDPVRPLHYDPVNGDVEDHPKAYVANCVIHKTVFWSIPPHGIFGDSPDSKWSLNIRECGFPIGFNPFARCFHAGNRKDFR